jgi:pimeloyl-ACP methyl ester carboxylesterase
MIAAPEQIAQQCHQGRCVCSIQKSAGNLIRVRTRFQDPNFTIMHSIRRGTGKPLLLVHGLGGSARSWGPVFDALTRERDVIAVDLPGFGTTPPLPGAVTISALADALTSYLEANGLIGIDAAGSSMGARLVVEMARRGGVLGGVVALDPGGFWRGWQRYAFYISIYLSIRLVRALRPMLPFFTRHAFTRALLLAQFSAHPSKLSPQLTLDELENYVASPSFDELLKNLAFGEPQEGASRGTLKKPLIIGWGRRDRICFPAEASRAQALFPDAQLHWFEDCGHFPHWDYPQASANLILGALSDLPPIAFPVSGSEIRIQG